MPLHKFRSIAEMPQDPEFQAERPLAQRIAAVLRLSAAMAPPFPRQVGVFKFRTIEEAQAHREAWELARSQAGRKRVSPDPGHS